LSSKFAVLTFFLVAGALILGVASLNYFVDPMCFYRCSSVDIHKKNLNTFFHVGQIIVSHPETENIMIGSSRGETTSPLWLEELLHMKSLNLSVGGTELQAKLAFLNMALKHTKVRQVIWQADFFEFIPEVIDVKMQNTEALRSYIKNEFQSDASQSKMSKLQDELKSLIDHISFEASLKLLFSKKVKPLDQGSGSDLKYKDCETPEYKGDQDPDKLEKEILNDYDRYRTVIFKNEFSEAYWRIFVEKLKSLDAQGIEVKILVAPYNPLFMKRLALEYPKVYNEHFVWIKRLKSLSLSHVHITDFFTGIPGDDQSAKYWNDGVHFTCRGAMIMLRESLKNSP